MARVSTPGRRSASPGPQTPFARRVMGSPSTSKARLDVESVYASKIRHRAGTDAEPLSESQVEGLMGTEEGMALVQAGSDVAGWLNELGVGEFSVGMLISEILPFAADGVLLLAVLEAIDHVIVGKGVTLECRVRAQALHNVEAAFEHCRRKPRIPLQLLICAEDVVEGVRDAILPLLLQLKVVSAPRSLQRRRMRR